MGDQAKRMEGGKRDQLSQTSSSREKRQINSRRIDLPIIIGPQHLSCGWAHLSLTHLVLCLGDLPHFCYVSSFGRPSCQLVLPCLWAPYLVFVTITHVGDPLANSSCLVFGNPTLFLLQLLMWAPLLQTHLALRLGPHPFSGHLENINSKPNFSLFIIWLIFLPSAPLSSPFCAFHVGGHTSFQLSLCCVWALCLIFVMFPLVGTPLANSPFLTFGHTTLFSLRFFMWAPLLQNHLVLRLGAQPCPRCLEKVKSKSFAGH
jgi:hypothetical protein